MKAHALFSAALALVAPALAQQPFGTRVVVVAPAADDARIDLVRDAIGFWNRTFEDLGLEPVLGLSAVEVAPAGVRAIENYAWQISRRAGRRAAGPLEPAPPAALTSLEGEVVVLLSAHDLMPFAWPLPGARRYLVAVDLDPGAPAAGMLRVVAHELGHTLGLRHHRGDPSSLMCMPCSRSAHGDGDVPLLLGARERARLLELYPVVRSGRSP